ncbi:Protein SLG1 [Neophaeococcomyces mojaviensis]|uniref:Protein SLG1 n=1 Tax=Neophaeococcomyces mojaviensis TaxID=3383035 RepID=A0ACC3A2C3_9EURO|nr:Protein SLG1 [Knufia sp. JES_112]
MKTSMLFKSLQVSILGLLATQTLAQSSAASTPASNTVELGAIQTRDCYSSPGPLKQDNTNTFQTSGLCQTVCGNQNHAVMAITGGSTCYCGDMLPALDSQVDISFCNSPCQGFGQQSCGGIGYWQVYLTGLTGDVQTAPNSTTSSSSAPASTSTHAVQSTIIVTASATAKPPIASGSNSGGSSGGSGPNKVGIAVGVVVGVIAVAAIAGAVIMYLKQKRRKEIEEEHKAAAAVNQFIGSRSSDTKSDSRLDPSMASYRRESIGSIADERDFSRRILQVRNPDRGSMNSVA